MSRPIQSGPMMPLAIMAVLALVIPVIWAANSTSSLKTSSAKAPVMTVPTNEPKVLLKSPTPKVYPSGKMPLSY